MFGMWMAPFFNFDPAVLKSVSEFVILGLGILGVRRGDIVEAAFPNIELIEHPINETRRRKVPLFEMVVWSDILWT